MGENLRRELFDEIVNRKRMGDKKFHSESSLHHSSDDDDPNTKKDPGVQNSVALSEDRPRRVRTVSQPGPMGGSMQTATAARAARRRPQRTVMYAEPTRQESLERQPSKNFLAPPKMVDADTLSFPGDRSNTNIYNSNYKNVESRSLNSYRYTPNDMRSLTPRKRSVATMDAQSIRSMETIAPPPTDAAENKKQTVENLTFTLSCIYAIFLVTLGMVSYIGDIFIELSVAPIYNLVLTCIGFIYMLYLHHDLKRYKNLTLKRQKTKIEYEEKLDEYMRKQDIESGSSSLADGEPNFKDIPLPPPFADIPIRHDYCFSQGRHSGSFYLKLGAAGFALGHLVHSILLITVQIYYITDEQVNNNECVDISLLILDIINPLYCFFQLYFIFKYSNVIIMRRQGLAHFAFMHYIGSSLCFWFSAIVRETVLALTLYSASKHKDDSDESLESGEDIKSHFDAYFDISNLYDERCMGQSAMKTIFENFSPYLYPFTVEFNIFIVAVYYIIFSNIGSCSDGENANDIDSIAESPTSEENDFSSNIIIYADCHASNRGLFLSMVIMVLMIGVVIIGFVFGQIGGEYLEVGYIMNTSMKLFLHISLLAASIMAFTHTSKMDINEHPISLLDDILLFICLPAFFMETILSLIASINIVDFIQIFDFVVMVVQVVIQTLLIVDGLRRCSNTRKLRRTKPGRGIMMFLIIVNVAVWIFNTFSYKSPESLDTRYAYYGKTLWTILGHVTLPLIMFYRFHSSVCFADIWNSAYKPGLEH